MMQPQTPEELRQVAVAQIDRIIEAGPIVHQVIGADGLRLAKAMREFVRGAINIEVEKLFDLWKAQPQ